MIVPVLYNQASLRGTKQSLHLQVTFHFSLFHNNINLLFFNVEIAPSLAMTRGGGVVAKIN